MIHLKRELIISGDGSHTVFVPELNEHYHSIHGAVQESSIVFINNGLAFSRADPVHIFEVGFGTGLNALLACVYCSMSRRKARFVSVEKYPLDKSITERFNHASFAGNEGMELFRRIHDAEWGIETVINEYFTLQKLEFDLVHESPEGNYNLIFFDAFGPEKQPEMWSQSIFRKISSITLPSGILVTYSAKGEVKRNLRAEGFKVELLPGPPHKRDVLRATKM